MKYSKIKASKILGLSDAFFHTCNKTLFRFCMFHGKGDLVEGYKIYNKYISTLKVKFNEIYYSYESTYTFAQSLEPLNIYKSLASACISLDEIFNSNTHKLQGIKTMKKIVKFDNELTRKFKNKKCDIEIYKQDLEKLKDIEVAKIKDEYNTKINKMMKSINLAVTKFNK